MRSGLGSAAARACPIRHRRAVILISARALGAHTPTSQVTFCRFDALSLCRVVALSVGQFLFVSLSCFIFLSLFYEPFVLVFVVSRFNVDMCVGIGTKIFHLNLYKVGTK